MNNFIHFSTLTNEQFGGKATNLAHLFQKGFNVPNGFIIPATIIESKINQLNKKEVLKTIEKNQNIFDDLLKDAIQVAENKFGENYNLAIRSSVNLEDGSQTSFAGQFNTVLNITNKTEFKNGFLSCFLSKYSDEATAYCKLNNIDTKDLKINIIVQQMVDADYAGVCFSVNPLTGNEKEMLVEAVKGLGEKLVQGQITPTKYKIDWYNHKIKRTKQKNDILNDELLFKLANQSLEIQQIYGLPQDIEWAIKDNELFILQARPLTAIHFESKYDWTNADLKDGGISSEVTTPFMYKLYEYAFETTMKPYLKSIKIHPPYNPEKWFTQYMLYSYWNLSATKDGLKKIPGFIEREFDEDLGVTPNYKGKGYETKLTIKSAIQGIQILLAIKKSITKTIKKAKIELNELDSIIKKNKQIKWDELSDTHFIESFNNLIHTDYLKVEGNYFLVIYDNSNLTTLFKDLLKSKNKKQTIQYLNLITGLQNLSHLKPSFALWDLSRSIRKNKKAFQYYTTKTKEEINIDYIKQIDFPFKNEFLDFIDKYGFHSEKELHLLEPNWHENPKQAITTLQNFINKEDSENIRLKNEKQKQVFEQEFQKIKSNKLKKEIQKHRQFLWLREEYRDRSSQMYDIIRTVSLIAGERLVTKKSLKNKEDIFFVYPSEVSLLFNKTKPLKSIENNKIIYRSFRNYDRPNEIWSNQQDFNIEVPENAIILKGISCSPGVIEAEVFVAKTINEANNMPEGKILITQFTDPAWTVYFSKIKGLVTETGGVLSHGAIISREYGIPAVLGAKNITRTLKTGDKIRLNGTTGVIELLDK